MSKGREEWSCALLDISLKGMLVETPTGIEPESEAMYAIELVLGAEVSIKMQAKISHASDKHWGLAWENIDLEGLTHLRRLLELNLADPDEMDRELADLG